MLTSVCALAAIFGLLPSVMTIVAYLVEVASAYRRRMPVAQSIFQLRWQYGIINLTIEV